MKLVGSKQNRLEIANKNLNIFRKGKYTSANKAHVNIVRELNNMCNHNFFYPESYLSQSDISGVIGKTSYEEVKDKITVENKNVIDCILEEKGKMGVLNFASARHAGGGYLYGSNAQEEALCYSSLLYNALVRCEEFYTLNDKENRGHCYTDSLIYTEQVPFIRDAEFNLLDKPVLVDVVTCPAPNLNAMGDERIKEAEEALYRRMTYILNVSKDKVNTLILGAFGCGVFGNSPEKVAKIWYDLLINKGFIKHFKKIVFAVYKNEANLRAFEEVFK